MTHAIVLGCGMVGSAMATDLAGAGPEKLRVTVADSRAAALQQVAATCTAKTVQADLSDPAEVTRVVRDADIVLGALSSHLGLQTLRAVIEAGKPYVDISFMAEDATSLDGLARERGVVAVVDCGVAPGMSNMTSGYAAAHLEPCERLEIYVGGLPAIRRWPFDYKAGFAPADVLEEYTRPARMVEHGQVVVYPALSGVERVDVPGIGTLEAFNTDGLRSLIHTLKVPTMIEKTMRWPGHVQLMEVLRDLGLFSKDPIHVNGQQVVPLDLTSALLFPKWTFEPGEADITVMRVSARGRKQGRAAHMVWDLIDHYDPKLGQRSMSRTTAFPATIVAQMILEGRFSEPGVHPPETLGKIPGFLDEVLHQLQLRGVQYSARIDLD